MAAVLGYSLRWLDWAKGCPCTVIAGCVCLRVFLEEGQYWHLHWWSEYSRRSSPSWVGFIQSSGIWIEQKRIERGICPLFPIFLLELGHLFSSFPGLRWDLQLTGSGSWDFWVSMTMIQFFVIYLLLFCLVHNGSATGSVLWRRLTIIASMFYFPENWKKKKEKEGQCDH